MAAQTQSQGGINQCSLHLAMELDGAQHVADAGAYRRDRRKDAMLQENGYMVLRFLAEDVGKRLDDVLRAYPNNQVVMRPSEKFEAEAAGPKWTQAWRNTTSRTFWTDNEGIGLCSRPE